MPCDTVLRQDQTLAQRMSEIDVALKRLEMALQSGQAKVAIGPTGAVAFQGWSGRDDITDVCAFRTLTAQNSWALRQAVARAQATSGRRVNPRAVAAGVHSHDSGSTWHKGH